MSGFDDYRDLCEERDQLRAELEASRRELFAYQADVEGANRRELSFATACVRNVEGITVGGALEMQRDEIASLRAELAELRARVSAQNDRLAHIAEYWNGERNDQAMYDALCHIVDEAGSALPVPPAAVPDVFIEHSVMRPPVKPAAVPDDVAKDAERYRACRYAALAADNDPLIEQMLDWPNVSTADEFDIQTDQIAAILAAKEKGQ